MLIQTFQNGKYIVERSFDSGRFTTSYLAKKSDGERWIVKVLNPQILAGLASEEKDRRESLFWQEAIKLSKCSKNPHIAKVGMPFKEDDFICLPIEYFAGNSLAERPERCLTEQVALNYIRQIGDALDAVHREGFVHCDVCPENIHLRIRKGNVEAVLTNFELAIDSNTELSRTRTRERTDGYSPIELYSRFDKTGQRIGAYTDVYSLAATLYQLLTGEAPCSAEKRIAKGKGKDELIAPQSKNSAISGKVNDAIIKGMKIFAYERPQSVKDWVSKLDIKLDSQKKIQSRMPDWDKWQAYIAILTAFITLLVGVPAFFDIFLHRQQPAEPSSPPSNPSQSGSP